MLNFFQKLPCGIDVQRAHQLVTTIQEDGTSEITSLLEDEEEQPETIQVLITAELIVEAFGVSAAGEGTSLKTKKDLQSEVSTKKGAVATFFEMVCRQVELPTRLFMHFLMFEDKRPARYTTPNIML